MKFEDINKGTMEGRMLYAALAKITTESQTDKTPFEVMEQITCLMESMDFPPLHDDEAVGNLQKYAGIDFKAEGEDILPSFRLDTVEFFKISDLMPALPCFIRARHQHAGGWKYDIGISTLKNGKYVITRLYNIEEFFLQAKP